MIKLIEDYLNAFRAQLRGSDRATVQDALSDAEDHLSSALKEEMELNPEEREEEAAEKVIEKYGDPSDLAEYYRNVEKYTTPAITAKARRNSGFGGFIGVLGDPSAWASLLYMIISLATGVIYFSWAVTGISVTAGALVLIVGIPFAWIFFLSVRGLAFVEGRIVEALLGARMPRRPVFVRKGPGWWGSIKGVLSTGSSWSAFLYLVIMLPLGTLYFTVFTVLLSVSLFMIFDPVLELVFKIPLWDLPQPWWTPVWLMPVIVIAGFCLFLGMLHLAKLTGKLQGRLARTMLVSG